jgi:hypothetical protein
MRAREFVRENTVSGGIATVSMPIGEVITRPGLPNKTKYKNSYVNAWPKGKKNAGR